MIDPIKQHKGTLERWLWYFSIVFCAWIPFSKLGLDWSSQVISIRDSEFPIKVWSYVTFSEPTMWFGGRVETASFPLVGTLNNPDLFAGVFFWMGDVLGFDQYHEYGSVFNLLLYSVMVLNITAGAFLSRQFGGEKWINLLVGVFFAWQPLLLSYGFASNITDLTHLWPFALGLGFVKRAVDEDNPSDGIFAGLFFALGFLTCPYNFVLFIPILPVLIWWVYRHSNQWGTLLWNTSWVAAVLLLLYGLRVAFVMNQAGSLVAADAVESVRHVYPFDGLRADKETRFAAFFMELTGVLPKPVVVMEQVARFTRHFQWGVLTWVLVIVGIWRAKEVRTLSVCGVVIGVGTCIGPFASMSPFSELSGPYNPIYWWSYVLPVGKMILEPFRYVLVSGVFMSVLVSIALVWVSTRWRPWVGVVVGACLLGEVSWRTPQLPLPVQPLPTDERMNDLPVSDGGVVHLPFFASHSNRFNRSHFWYQLQHQHPVADPIMGFPSPFVIENALLCELVHAETVIFPMDYFPCSLETVRKGWMELQNSGIGSIVIDPTKYAEDDWIQIDRIIQQLPVQPTEYNGLRIIEISASP